MEIPNMRRLTQNAILILITIAACAPLRGADSAVDDAKAIAPFLESGRISLAHIDLTRIDIAAVSDSFAKLMPDAAAEAEPVRVAAQRVHQSLQKAGVKDLYVLVSLSDLPQEGPAIVIPNSASIDIKALEEALSWAPNRKPEAIRGSVVVASPGVITKLKQLKPADHPELAEAFRAAGNKAFEVVVTLSDDDRRVIEEMQPELPAQIGGGPSTIVTHGLTWLAVGIDPPPRTSLNITVQSKDATAAAALHAKLAELQPIAGKLAGGQGNPELEKLLAALLPQIKGSQLVLNVESADAILDAAADAIRPAINAARTNARRTQSMNNMKQIGLAMHIFHDSSKHFPSGATFDAAGKPLLSWRVQILPYLDQKALYDKFHLNEPWDSEHNRALIAEMPAVFKSPGSKQEQGQTVYREMTGEHTAFPPKNGVEIKQITDGTSNTVLVLEVDDQHAVPWTKPEGIPFQKENPVAGLAGQSAEGFLTLFGDGSVRFIAAKTAADVWQKLLMIDDGQPLPADF
jgi:hypothetical protein